MKISEKYETFNEEKVENIVKELIESGVIFTVEIYRAFKRTSLKKPNF